MSDEALVGACATGDNVALGALYDRHAGSLRRFLARLSGTDERDLDDLVQQTFEAIARAAPRFHGRSSVRTWLFGIANNTARHHVRTERRRRHLVDAAALEIPRTVAGPDIIARERAAQLQEAIVALPQKLREVFVLVYLEGVEGTEVARLLGMREGAVWKRLHEARAKLRTSLEGTRS